MELQYCYVTPMLILHNVYFEVEGRAAQIDFLVFTKKFCVVIESKFWTKNIEVNCNGEFVVVDGSRRPGMYSPITQNKRHMEVIKQLELERTGEITPSFKEIYKSLIVFSNDEILINKEAATNEVNNQVLRRDQLVEYIENEYKVSENPELSDAQLEEWAKWFLDRSKDKVELLRAYAKGIVEVDFISDENKIRSWLKNIGEAVDKYGDDILAIIEEEDHDI